MALSLGLPPLGVAQHLALRSSDFPQAFPKRNCLRSPGLLTDYSLLNNTKGRFSWRHRGETQGDVFLVSLLAITEGDVSPDNMPVNHVKRNRPLDMICFLLASRRKQNVRPHASRLHASR